MEDIMANVVVRGQPEQGQAALVPVPLEPFRLMRSLLGWDPFQEMVPMLRRPRIEFIPAFEIKETKDNYLFKADVPGVKMSDLDVSISSNQLTVSGKREAEPEEKAETYYACERSYGSFSRSFTMPEAADTSAVSAELKDGVLTVSIKKKPASQPKKVDIKSQSSTAKPH
jgi:HSP20 family protein